MPEKKARLLDGRREAKKIYTSIKKELKKSKIKPNLGVVLVGNNKASQTYVNIKEKKAKELGIGFEKHVLPTTSNQEKIINLIHKLNQNEKINGILLQLPLPQKFNTQKIINSIDSSKDVDGFINLTVPSPTVSAVIQLLKQGFKEHPTAKKKKIALLVNSAIFGQNIKNNLPNNYKIDIFIKPNKKNLSQFLFNYGAIVIALGKKHWLTANMIEKNSIIVDVGINRNKNSKKIFGDVHPESYQKTRFISPVPGGVGTLTVAHLFKNLLKLKKHKKEHVK